MGSPGVGVIWILALAAVGVAMAVSLTITELQAARGLAVSPRANASPTAGSKKHFPEE
jgi:hypothetical protein